MKLALGTVQFGLDYGISNHSGQVKIEEVNSILAAAKKHNIDILDTAAGYGNSEIILGRAGVFDYQVITKTTSIGFGVGSVIENFYRSLERLKLSGVKGLLIHDINEVKHDQFDILYQTLTDLKEQGLVQQIGFSTYTPRQVDLLLEHFDFDLIQVPFNVFDTRLLEGGQFNRLKKQNVEIHARSIFLQGLLLDLGSLDSYFNQWADQFYSYRKIVEESNASLVEYALSFALNVPDIDKVLVGVESKIQLMEIIKSSEKRVVTSAYSIDDVNLLNPSLWKI